MSLVGFPLLLIPLAIINIIVFLMPGVSFTDPLATVALVSGAPWKVSFADVLLALSVVLILFGVLKAARPQGRYFTDHLLAFLALAGAVAEFLLLPQFATSVMFLLAVMMAVDFLAGVLLRLQRPVARRAPVGPPVGPETRLEPVVPPLEPPVPPPAAPASAAPTVGASAEVPASHVPPTQGSPSQVPPSQVPSAPDIRDPVR
jgi:hypothetical protein